MTRAYLNGLSTRLVRTGREFESRKRPVLYDPETVDRNGALVPRLALGHVGSGKTQWVSFVLTEFIDRPPKSLKRPAKIIVIDTTGRLETSTMFCPCLPGNPLYRHLTNQSNETPDGEEETFREPDGSEHVGVNPKGYPVEVRSPLLWSTTGRPALNLRAPSMSKPFTIAIDELSNADWRVFLDLQEDAMASYLHQKVIAEGHRDGWLATATMEKLAAMAEKVAARKSGKHKVYTDKQLNALLRKYDHLAEAKVVMPKHPEWDEEGRQSLPWLDMRAVLEDTETVTVFNLDMSGPNDSLIAKILCYVLSSIIQLKDPNNSGRVKNPVVIGIPDLGKIAAPTFADDFMLPVRDRVLDLYARGAGNGIGIVGDTQNIGDLCRQIQEKPAALALFVTQKDDIRDLLKNFNIANKDEFTDIETTSQLHKKGSFIWIPPNSSQAEKKGGAIPRFNYPRYELDGLTEWNYEQLWPKVYPRSKYPEKYIDLAPYYSLAESMSRYAAEAREKARLEASPGAREPVPVVAFGEQAAKRLRALCARFEGKKAVSLSAAGIAEAIDAELPPTADPRSKVEIARSLMMSVEKKKAGLVRKEDDMHGGVYWWIELKKLREVLKAKEPEPVAPSVPEPEPIIPPPELSEPEEPSGPEEPARSEAALKVAAIGDEVKLALLDGRAEDAMNALRRLVEAAKEAQDDPDVVAVMIGFMGSKLPLTPAMKAMLNS